MWHTRLSHTGHTDGPRTRGVGMSIFDRAIERYPTEWSKPILEVVDTAGVIRCALIDWKIDSPELLLGLTTLAIQRYDKLNSSEGTL